MKVISIRNLSLGLLGLAIAISAYILIVDDFLWLANPINYHAYGLLVFLVVDILLVVMLVLKWRFAVLSTFLWGGLQVMLIIGDIATGLGIPGFTSSDAFNYLILGEGNSSGLATTFLVVVYGFISALSLIELLKTGDRIRKDADVNVKS